MARQAILTGQHSTPWMEGLGTHQGHPGASKEDTWKSRSTFPPTQGLWQGAGGVARNGDVPHSHLESWGEGGHLWPGSFRELEGVSPPLCAAVQGQQVHARLLHLWGAVGLEFGSRNKPSGTCRTGTHPAHGALLPGTCRTGCRRQGWNFGCFLAWHSSPAPTRTSLGDIQEKSQPK